MARYWITIFLSAFLLFQVQPLIGKTILPWFGGGPAVWTACMLFFQTALLGGYAYAHAISSKLSPRALCALHLGLLAVSLCLLPIGPSAEFWRPEGGSVAIAQILLLLSCTIGLPYFLLSSTGPLLQEAFHRETNRAPYRLYSLSNAGSLLALLSYPFVFEPRLPLATQFHAWSAGYALFALSCGYCIWRNRLLPARAASGEVSLPRVSRGVILLWLGLAACGSVMLLATTNQMALEIPSIPFLWVLPLALYLLSFIICFDHDRWYHRGVFGAMFVVALGGSGYALYWGHHLPIWQQITIYPSAMFAAAMVCHGGLARLRPAPSRSTLFYLCVSAGGALGGILVAIVAPLLLPDFWEYQIGSVATAALAIVSVLISRRREGRGALWHWFAGSAIVAALSIGAVFASSPPPPEGNVKTKIATTRDFYGVLRVSDNESSLDPLGPWRLLQHGDIDHGVQYLDEVRRYWATTYYVANSGIGLAIGHHPRRESAIPTDRGLRIGVVGLGAGTLAASGRPFDSICFYEINPRVVDAANEYFTYLKDSQAGIEVVLGDARIELERELAAGRPRQFDVLAIDAFSSDSIPMHLLTLECVQLYRQHLKPDGILCIHISNLYLELSAVVRGIAEELQIPCAIVEAPEDYTTTAYYSVWALLTTNQEFLADPEVVEALAYSRAFNHPTVVWRDDYGSLWQVLRDFGPIFSPPVGQE